MLFRSNNDVVVRDKANNIVANCMVDTLMAQDDGNLLSLDYDTCVELSAKNANLIAAAPELLEAVKLLINDIVDGNFECEHLEFSKAVVLKAEGR